MTTALLLIALVILGSAIAAMTLRNLVHCVLLLIVTWAGVAAFYLWAGAEFLAFAQALIYAGAVSMVVLFAVLLTRQSRADRTDAAPSVWRIVSAVIAGGAMAGVLIGAIFGTPLSAPASPPPPLSVRQLGLELMGPQAAALLVVGVLLTVALLGAIVLAAREPAAKPPDQP